VRTAARQLDPAVSVDVGSADRLLGEQLRPLRLLTSALAAAGALALILAVTGLYAVVAYLVELRTREIGVRVALGATERRIVRLVLGQGMWLVGGGVVAGAGAALGLSLLLRGLFLGVPAGDPATFAAVAVLTAGVALVAAYLPARRAAEVDPMVALRTE
jgi:ABC-type antimicrobial peptide transport system permease subunit